MMNEEMEEMEVRLTPNGRPTETSILTSWLFMNKYGIRVEGVRGGILHVSVPERSMLCNGDGREMAGDYLMDSYRDVLRLAGISSANLSCGVREGEFYSAGGCLSRIINRLSRMWKRTIRPNPS